ncbi:MAG: hypothetical protein GWO41_16575 [candidate division Zixibacteria bacterium]|nr:hypothetical protein [candidate division Zixibacteria bacterium]NIS18027.1 hypothetical protein [candidate division Zixibacteria bacterium]NIS48807.1 hypothetical protein [candidate division Zixibacteria bacterium]NIT54307.1 hypothetical protein [candidate division Zixibacteria bacterium]NIU16883.1 hypothetical protein [candidate division Zixibacteria bacterium]
MASVLHVPAQYENIQAAVSNAQDGDTVLVAPGVYFEHVEFNGKAILLASHFVLDSDLNTVKATIISGSDMMHPDTGTVITFRNGETNASILKGFTIRSGFGTLIADSYLGGGILCINNSNPVICDNIIRENNAINGGGCAFLDSEPYFVRNRVIYNNALRGAGVYLDNSEAVIDYSIIGHNSATEDGGGIYISVSDSCAISDCVILNNNAAATGGISCISSTPDISYNDLYNNQHTDFGDCGEGLGDTLVCQNFNLIPSDCFYNIIRDPEFLDTVSFYPGYESPLIDAGSEFTADFPWDGLRTDIGPYEVHYLVGDSNSDERINITDAYFLIKYIFLGGPAPDLIYRGDFNCDRKLNLVDIMQIINYVFQSGHGPCINVVWPPEAVY